MTELFHALAHALPHALSETLLLLPFLYLTYLAIELLERHTGEHTERYIKRSGKAGPLLGALLGLVPQCGFSAAGAGLYAARMISSGTLLAIFWSTSDEMLPLLLSSGVPLPQVLKILLIKGLIAMCAGFLVDIIARAYVKRRGIAPAPVAIGDMCRAGHCHCDHRPFWLAALTHTLQIALTVFAVSTLLHTALECIGEDALTVFLSSVPVLSCLLAALVGLIPNCASSVAITTLYCSGVLSAGALLSGLLVGAGVGVLVLFRVNRPLKDSLRLLALLFIVGVGVGILFDALRLGALLGL